MKYVNGTHHIRRPKRNPHSYRHNHQLDCCNHLQARHYCNLELHNLHLLHHIRCNRHHRHIGRHRLRTQNNRCCHNHHHHQLLHIGCILLQLRHRIDCRRIVVWNMIGCSRRHHYHKTFCFNQCATFQNENSILSRTPK